MPRLTSGGRRDRAETDERELAEAELARPARQDRHRQAHDGEDQHAREQEVAARARDDERKHDGDGERGRSREQPEPLHPPQLTESLGDGGDPRRERPASFLLRRPVGADEDQHEHEHEQERVDDAGAA